MFNSRKHVRMNFVVFIALFIMSGVYFSLPGTSFALLIPESSGQLVLDDATNMVWVTDLIQFTNKSYSDQLAAISALSIPGYTGFRIASATEVFGLFNYGAAAIFALPFTPLFIGPPHEYVLDGRVSDLFAPYIDQPPVHVVIYSFPDGLPQYYLSMNPSADSANPIDGAWVVGTLVPEPATMLLLGLALVGLFGLGCLGWRG